MGDVGNAIGNALLCALDATASAATDVHEAPHCALVPLERGAGYVSLHRIPPRAVLVRAAKPRWQGLPPYLCASTAVVLVLGAYAAADELPRDELLAIRAAGIFHVVVAVRVQAEAAGQPEGVAATQRLAARELRRAGLACAAVVPVLPGTHWNLVPPELQLLSFHRPAAVRIPGLEPELSLWAAMCALPAPRVGRADRPLRAMVLGKAAAGAPGGLLVRVLRGRLDAGDAVEVVLAGDVVENAVAGVSDALGPGELGAVWLEDRVVRLESQCGLLVAPGDVLQRASFTMRLRCAPANDIEPGAVLTLEVGPTLSFVTVQRVEGPELTLCATRPPLGVPVQLSGRLACARLSQADRGALGVADFVAVDAEAPLGLGQVGGLTKSARRA